MDAGTETGGDGRCSQQTEDCFNGIDDDCNGHIDCDDPACTASAVCVPPASAGGTNGTVAVQPSSSDMRERSCQV